jgi:hypothetical protein
MVVTYFLSYIKTCSEDIDEHLPIEDIKWALLAILTSG